MPYKNPEDKKLWWIRYYNKNKQKIFSQKNKYKKDWRQTPAGIKARIIDNWKQMGLKLFGYTYDEVYEYYLDCDNCEVCNKDISMGGSQKNMDHCHSTGIFRWVLCSSCNNKDNWMDRI
tara:strand:- start:55 stop:411 length:357 start_codon:yes stop_codon:yes gene_type:complete